MQPGLLIRSSRPALALAVALVAWLGFAAPAAAGGWAVATLDAVPEARPGSTVEIGFTILQHGVTPAVLDEDVGIELTDADGTVVYFEAIADGPVGHYAADVTFPDEAGDYGWSVRMGWFGPYDLGTIDVASGDAGSTPTIWSIGRWVVAAMAVGLGAVAMWPTAARRLRPATR